jgi:hypothetical protein
MRSVIRRAGWLLPICAAAAGLATVRCSSAKKTATSTVSEAIQQSSNSTDAVEASGLMLGFDAFAPDAVEGFRCDPSPAITEVAVCGKSLPATVQLTWTDCEVPQGHGPPGPGPDGDARPMPDGGCMGPPGFGPPPGACGADGGICQAGGPPPPGPSSGTVSITNTYSTPDGCSGAIEEQQSVTFNVTRTAPNGDLVTVAGTSSSTTTFTPGSPPQSKSTTVDITETETDSSGTTIQSVQFTGTRSETLSSDTPPTRTVNENLTATSSDGTTSTITLTNVVYPPMSTCRWPTSGTLTETGADGGTTTLTYGPTCGQGTLNGSSVQLDTLGPGAAGPPPGGPMGPPPGRPGDGQGGPPPGGPGDPGGSPGR